PQLRKLSRASNPYRKIIMRKNLASQSGVFNPRVLLAFALSSVGAFLAMLSFAAPPPTEARRQTSEASGKVNFDKLPLTFESNVGQIDPAVRFLARSGNATFYFTSTEIVLALSGEKSTSKTRLEAA